MNFQCAHIIMMIIHIIKIDFMVSHVERTTQHNSHTKPTSKAPTEQKKIQHTTDNVVQKNIILYSRICEAHILYCSWYFVITSYLQWHFHTECEHRHHHHHTLLGTTTVVDVRSICSTSLALPLSSISLSFCFCVRFQPVQQKNLHSQFIVVVRRQNTEHRT